ncbi:hypothetical protein TVAG_430750 [Trichomonas vaginalis G3]|uniref:Uncharacterized protein n=1 Tax=Trichomonas vaginalis (strain ATCC PRA-98 / G3) TaxID=412133 RepID=A2E399_TRIV3|nr:hypothetical protein TVAGG3_1017620 [Trichomonas vaginalis G3]EAY12909.1 hypothetical protein TVAG_430750 [Trichomonas vaginalis G3]KAI5491920.1 hypothetical protein TVAGG3_1017620 [Trichomonas vaginalis G3]|eukprot:XP_001325132.1 hypothetical protein [Trichomonas vaginalis G3]
MTETHKQIVSTPTIASTSDLCAHLNQFKALLNTSHANLPPPAQNNIKYTVDLLDNLLTSVLFYKTILIALHLGILFPAMTFNRNSDEINFFITYKREFGDNEVIIFNRPKNGKFKIPISVFSDADYNKFVGLVQGLLDFDEQRPQNSLNAYLQQYKPKLQNITSNLQQIVSEAIEGIMKYIYSFDLTPYMAKFQYNLQKLRKIIAILLNMIKLEILSDKDRIIKEIFRFYINSLSLSFGKTTIDILTTILESSGRLITFSHALESKNLIISEIIEIISEISQILAPVATILNATWTINDFISFNSLKVLPFNYIFPRFLQTPFLQPAKVLKSAFNSDSTQFIREIGAELESFGIQIFSTPEKMMATGIIIPDVNNILTESHLLLRNLSFRFENLRYYYNSILVNPFDVDQIIELIKILNLISINNPDEFQDEISKLTTLMNILFQIHQIFICLDVFGISRYYISVTITHLCFISNKLKKSDKNQKQSLLVREDLIEFMTKKVKSILVELFSKNSAEKVKTTADIIMEPLKMLHLYFSDQRNTECLSICCETIYDLISNKNSIDNLDILLKHDISDDYKSIIEDLQVILANSKNVDSISEILKYLSEVSSDLANVDPSIVITQPKNQSTSDLPLKIVEFQMIYETMKAKRLLLVYDDDLFTADDFADRFVHFFKEIKVEKISKILKKILNVVKEIEPLYKLTKTILVGDLTRENIFHYLSLLFRSEIQISNEDQSIFVEEFEKLYTITNFAYVHDEIMDLIMKEKQNNLHLLLSLNQELIIDYFSSHLMLLHSAGFFDEKSGNLIFNKIIEAKTATNRDETIQLMHAFDHVLSSEGWRVNSILSRALNVIHAVLNVNDDDYIKLNELFAQFKTPEDLETVNKIFDEIKSSNLAEEQKEYVLSSMKLIKSYSMLVTLRKHLEIENNSIHLKNKIDESLIDDVISPSISVSKLNMPKPQLKVPISKLNFSQQSTIASIYEKLKEERSSMLKDVVKLIKVQNDAQSKDKLLNELKEKRKKLSEEVLNIYNDLERQKLSKIGFSMTNNENPDMKNQIENAKSINLQNELDKRSELLSLQASIIFRDNMFLKSSVLQKIEKTDNNTFLDSFYKNKKDKFDGNLSNKEFGALLEVVNNDDEYEALRKALIRKRLIRN